MVVDLKANIVLQSYGLPENPNGTGKNVPVIGTSCYSIQTIFNENRPVIYGSTDIFCIPSVIAPNKLSPLQTTNKYQQNNIFQKQ